MRGVINMWSMWRKRSNLLLLLLWIAIAIVAQERIRFVSYNVENLFDCVDDTLTNDDPFLPEATRHWTPYRYWNKLHAVSRAIASVGGDRAPDFVALCEVENDSVMHDLTRRSPLRTAGYDYLMTSSKDPRGIDVALMYKPTTFRPLTYRSIRLPKEYIPQGRHVRDVLFVSGQLHMGDTIDLFVCHLPSRLNGKQSEQLRHDMVNYLCSVIDSVCHERGKPHIIVMGDCNDSPRSNALRPLIERQGLVCVTEHLKGSYRYKGKWEQIDHIYLSPTLVGQKVESHALHLAPQGAYNCDADFLIEPEPLYGGHRPRRTYNGMRYEGGTSDHLPVCFDLGFAW